MTNFKLQCCLFTFFQEISSGIQSDVDMTSLSNYKDELLQIKEEKERLEGKTKKLVRELEHLQGIDGHYEVEEENITLKKDVEIKLSEKAEIHTKNTQFFEKEEEIKVLKIELSKLNHHLAAKVREVSMYSSCA